MLNLNQSSLMVEGCLRGIMSSQQGKSFEEIVGYAKYVMDENKIAKLDEEVYKPDVEIGVDSIVDILISNIEMKWTEDDIFRIEESELFGDITKMNERNVKFVQNESGRKRAAKQQKAETKEQPKQQKAESKDIRQKLIDMVNCRAIFDAIPEEEKEGKSFEDFQNEIEKIQLDKIEDPHILEMVELIKELSDDHYNKLKDAIHNAKSLEDMMETIAKVEMNILTEKSRTFEGFKSLLLDEFKVKNLTEDEMKTVYDVFNKALEDGELDKALDKALEQVNIKENRKEQKINRENDRPKNIHEEEWKRYFQLNLKNKKRGTMKGYLYKKAKLYRDSFGGNETPNNLVMRLNDIDRLLGSCLIYDTTLTNNDSIMKAVAKYLEDVLNKDNFSNSIMRDLIDRCLPQFEDIVING